MRAALLVAASLLAAGCLSASTGEAPATAASTPTVQIDPDRPAPVAGEVALGPAAAPDAAATLLEAPRLVEGEWWRIELESPLDGTKASFVRVVAEDAGDVYVMGMPHEAWWKEAVIYHMPFFGEVHKADLSGHAHDIPFQPLKFPLTDGATWETSFENEAPLTATVKTSSDQTAVISFTDADGDEQLSLVYDAKIHEISEFKVSFMSYKVVEHGYGFVGWVTVPRGEDLVFFHGRIGPVIDLSLAPAPPVETVSIVGGFNRVTFVVIVGGASVMLGLPSDGPGVFRETVTAPDGTKYEAVQGPAPGTKVVFFENAAPEGDWSLEHVAAGPGVVFVEGIAYHQYDIRLEKQPDGSVQNVGIRSDHAHEVIR